MAVFFWREEEEKPSIREKKTDEEGSKPGLASGGRDFLGLAGVTTENFSAIEFGDSWRFLNFTCSRFLLHVALPCLLILSPARDAAAGV